MARPVSLVSVLVVTTLLAGCSSGSSSSGSAAADSGSGSSAVAAGSGGKVAAGAVAPDAVDGAAAVNPDARGAVSSSSGSSSSSGNTDSGKDVADPAGARVVRTAQLTLKVRALPAAVAQAEAVATGLGGMVGSESSQFPTGPGSNAESVLTLRVPEPRTDDALNRLGAVGQELDRSTSAQDVTSTIADLDSREQTQAASVARVRDLMNRASSLKDVVLLESELSRRQSDLEALEAQQRVLSDQADLATITVTLVTAAVPATKPHHTRHNGFVTGLRAGGRAVAHSTALLLVGLGAVLPFALILALLGGLAYPLNRRRHRPAPTAAVTPVTDPATSSR